MAALHASIKQACTLCQQNHQIWICPKFLRMNTDERHVTAQKRGFCLACLMRGYWVFECKSKRSCTKPRCTKHHHALLHPEQENSNKGTETCTSFKFCQYQQ
ncbi:hypothetical protein T10_9964 [Trichinella papuae]|uniref:Uncharacterized protein n=1 Tax=Trichinella papuae TaxID=268474 RepID=A0A0V1MEY7_9BILA|nr:hypothetical protein T10_9964 [Trichinella papuae]